MNLILSYRCLLLQGRVLAPKTRGTCLSVNLQFGMEVQVDPSTVASNGGFIPSHRLQYVMLMYIASPSVKRLALAVERKTDSLTT
jgi:hypothetical protein